MRHDDTIFANEGQMLQTNSHLSIIVRKRVECLFVHDRLCVMVTRGLFVIIWWQSMGWLAAMPYPDVSERGTWREVAFQCEEEASEAYDKKAWKPAAEAMARAQLAYAYAFRGAVLEESLKRWWWEAPFVARAFFRLLRPTDAHEEVYGCLQRLFQAEPEAFRAHPQLAMAMALVYDQSPPQRHWPHRQVSRDSLDRRLPELVEAFRFWVETDREKKGVHRLDALLMEELTYVVDVSASIDELRWARDHVEVTAEDLNRQYWEVPYDYDRYETLETTWRDGPYQLSAIREKGGICVDQAYYLTQVAKAHLVPSIAVIGVMEDGLHAWVGYLEAPGKWNFEAGRRPDSAYVTGRTFDPQTWERPMDHELAFLKERLAEEPRYRRAQLHFDFALLAQREGNLLGAKDRAARAVREHPRHLPSWEWLLQVGESEDVAMIEKLARQAAIAFNDYPDLEARFLRKTASLVEARGESAEGQQLRQRIVSRNRKDRPDLALTEAATAWRRAMREESLDALVNRYRRDVSTFRKAGLITGHRIVRPFVNHLMRIREWETAEKAIAFAAARLEVPQQAQLDRLVEDLREDLSRRRRSESTK